MTSEQLLERLEAVSFFENYPEDAKRDFTEHILKGRLAKQVTKQEDQEVAEDLAEVAERFPGLSACPMILFAEWDGTLAKLVKHIAKHSIGMLSPENVKQKSMQEGTVFFLRFDIGETAFQDEVEKLDEYLPVEFFPIINDALNHACRLNLYVFNLPDPMYHFGLAFATERAMAEAVDAGLFPEPIDLGRGTGKLMEHRLAAQCEVYPGGREVLFKKVVLPVSENPDPYYEAAVVVGFYKLPESSDARLAFVRVIYRFGDEDSMRKHAEQTVRPPLPYIEGEDCLLGTRSETLIINKWAAPLDCFEDAMSLNPFTRIIDDEIVFGEYNDIQSRIRSGSKLLKSVDKDKFSDASYINNRDTIFQMIARNCQYLHPAFSPEVSDALHTFDKTPWVRKKKD